jgi:hypothetical protein
MARDGLPLLHWHNGGEGWGRGGVPQWVRRPNVRDGFPRLPLSLALSPRCAAGRGDSRAVADVRGFFFVGLCVSASRR